MRTSRLGRRVALAAALGLGLACSRAAETGPHPDAWVEIAGQRVAVERAIDVEEKARGLSGRDELPWDTGMLFEYEEPGFYAFWMRDVRFDLDFVWIRDGRIVDLHHRVPAPDPTVPPGELPTYRPRELADRILEVPGGYASAHGWRAGDRVRVEYTRTR